MAPAMDKCRLLPGAFGIVMQILLGILSFSSLLVKWRRERPIRPFMVFAKDSSKQAIAGLWLHCTNLLTALLLAGREDSKKYAERFHPIMLGAEENEQAGGQRSLFYTEDLSHHEPLYFSRKLLNFHGEEHEPHGSNQCDWYWINIVFDVLVGTWFTYVYLKCSQRIFKYKSGDYSYSEWAYTQQACIYLGVVTLMKLTLLVLFVLFKGPLLDLAAGVLYALRDSPQIKLFVVMILTPVTVNSMQFWLQDSFLKDNSANSNTATPLAHMSDLIYDEEENVRGSDFTNGAQHNPSASFGKDPVR